MTQLLDNTCKSTIFANIRTPAEDEKSSENYDYYGFLLKSIELQLRYSLFLYFTILSRHLSFNKFINFHFIDSFLYHVEHNIVLSIVIT